MPKYYRTLISKEHFDNWKNRNFFSTHAYVPGEWSKKYYESLSVNESDYPLNCSNSVFTEKGRKLFLELAPKYKKNDLWSQEDRLLVGELDGICAFNNPLDAFHYGRDSLAGKSNFDRYVEFEGSVVCKDPHDNGFVVTVIETDGIIYTADDFAKKHNFELS